MTSLSQNTTGGPIEAATPIWNRFARLVGLNAEEVIQKRSTNRKLEQISQFLDVAQLEPTPEAYKLIWEYHYGASEQLRISIDQIIKNHGRVPIASISELTATYLNILNISEVSELVRSGNKALSNGFKVISESREENRDYGVALESEIGQMDKAAPSQHSLTALISLTNTMVEKSQEAERQLKEAQENIVHMRKKLDDATHKAETDQLTGLPNRWAFEEHLKDALLRSREAVEPLAVAFVDIDKFKLINDVHGHATGDRILKRVAQYLDNMSDEKCHLARHGGEEFVILFSDKSSQQAFDIVDGIRAELARQNFTNRDNEEPIGTVSFSAGIAMLESDGDSSAMLRRADSALYRAKQNGRNQVIIDNK